MLEKNFSSKVYISSPSPPFTTPRIHRLRHPDGMTGIGQDVNSTPYRPLLLIWAGQTPRVDAGLIKERI